MHLSATVLYTLLFKKTQNMLAKYLNKMSMCCFLKFKIVSMTLILHLFLYCFCLDYFLVARGRRHRANSDIIVSSFEQKRLIWVIHCAIVCAEMTGHCAAFSFNTLLRCAN